MAPADSSRVVAAAVGVVGEARGVVKLAPERAPAGLGVDDVVDEPLDEARLGFQQGEPVLLLHEEQGMHASGERGVDQLANLGSLR
jgi:hypothetical protein